MHLPVDARCDVDNDSCTQDTCDPAHSTALSGCRLAGYKKAGKDCDDHNACTEKEHCVAIGTDPSGTVVTQCAAGTPSPGARECDGNECTLGDTCDSAGRCTPGAQAARVGTKCDDGNVCTTKDRCAIVSGRPQCVGTADSENMVCSDGNECTAGDHCKAGVCLGETLANGTPCDDGNLCTADTGDMCIGGICDGGAAKDCSTAGLSGALCEPSDGLCCGRSASGSNVC